MLGIKLGYYSFFNDQLLKMHHSKMGWEVISNDLTFVKYGFIRQDNYCSKIVDERQKIKAFEVSTYCNYKGYVHFIDTILSSGLYRIWPLEEAQIHFKDFARHGYDPVYEVEENELEEIWEERKPIEGFVFDVEPIVYIKKNTGL